VVEWFQCDSLREVSSNVPVSSSQRCYGCFNIVTAGSGNSASDSATFWTSFAWLYLSLELRGAFLELSSTNKASDNTQRKILTLKEYQA